MNEESSPLVYRVQMTSLVIGIIGLIASYIDAYFNRQDFFISYLFSYLFWLGISLGGMVIVMIYYLTGGNWGKVIRRPLEAAAQALPLMAILFIPIIFGLSDLYVWTHPEVVAHDHKLQEKVIYLNVPFFIIRAGIYFIIWLSLAYWLYKWSLEQDHKPESNVSVRLQRLSGAGIILYGFSITLAATDWVMSLMPQWYSTAFGLLFGVGQMMSAMAFAILMAAAFPQKQILSKLTIADCFHDLGNLLLMFLVLWAYIAFMQYLIIWSENLPPEISWYLPRVQGIWLALTAVMLILHFVIPFIMLLFRRAKRTVGILVSIAAIILLAHLARYFWLVVPSLHVQHFLFHWTYFTIPLGIGGIWLATVLWQFQKRTFISHREK
ncbi:MAG: hypothetical protein ACU4EQ_05560 [Candidatus Nitrosoglobus sp.]